MKSKISKLMTLLIFSLVLCLGYTLKAEAAISGNYRLKNLSGQYVTMPSTSKEGSQLRAATLSQTSKHQVLIFSYDEKTRTYQMKFYGTASGKIMNIGIKDSVAGSKVTANEASNNISQKWVWRRVANKNAYYLTPKTNSNVCLTLKDGRLILKAYCGAKSQLWRHEAIPVSQITLNQTVIDLGYEKEYQLKTTILPVFATNKTIRWINSNPDAVSVSETGLLKGLQVDQKANIYAKTNNGLKARCVVTVLDAVPETSVMLNKTKEDIGVNQTLKLTASLAPVTTTTRTLTWESSNPAVATVATNGLVRGIKKGKATITVTTAHGYTATCMITVSGTKKLGSKNGVESGDFPAFNQAYDGWRYQRIGGSTIGAVGCYITCYTEMCNYYGADYTPSTYAYASTFDRYGNCITHPHSAEYITVNTNSYSDYNTNEKRLQLLFSLINQGKPVIIHMPNANHFVVVYGYQDVVYMTDGKTPILSYKNFLIVDSGRTSVQGTTNMTGYYTTLDEFYEGKYIAQMRYHK